MQVIGMTLLPGTIVSQMKLIQSIRKLKSKNQTIPNQTNKETYKQTYKQANKQIKKEQKKSLHITYTG